MTSIEQMVGVRNHLLAKSSFLDIVPTGNYRKRYWGPCLKAAGVKPVGQHSARHSFVSTLQAQGVEIGLVAKLAKHFNPDVTLGRYTQAVRGGAETLAMLDRAYQWE